MPRKVYCRATIKQFALTVLCTLHIIKIMKRTPLSRVENLIRRVVEEPFSWFSNGALDPFQLATYLSRYYDGQTGTNEQPNRFVVTIHPDDFSAIEPHLVAFESQVADYVVLMAARRGYHLKEPPRIIMEFSEQEKTRSAHVAVMHEDERIHDGTAIYSDYKIDNTEEAIKAADAFLIVHGREHIALDRPVIRIGRRVDNDIILDIPSISRQHALIRWRQRYFVLYDVSSHGRSLVNGVRTREHILRPGDVIALSDVLLVYGEGRESVQGVASFDEQDEMETTMLKPEE